MSHFHTSSLGPDEKPEAAELLSPWPGLAVKVDRTVTGEVCLIVMPTASPLVRPGLPFVKIGMKYPILTPYVNQPGKYRDMREAGIPPGRPDATWWISRHTEDPFHVLLAWNGRDVLNLPGTNHSLIEIAKS